MAKVGECHGNEFSIRWLPGAAFHGRENLGNFEAQKNDFPGGVLLPGEEIAANAL